MILLVLAGLATTGIWIYLKAMKMINCTWLYCVLELLMQTRKFAVCSNISRKEISNLFDDHHTSKFASTETRDPVKEKMPRKDTFKDKANDIDMA